MWICWMPWRLSWLTFRALALCLCSDEGLTFETSANLIFTAFNISTSTLCWFIPYCLSVCLPTYLSIYLFYLSIYLFYLSIYLFYLSIYLSIYLFYLSIYLSIYFIYLSIYLSVFMSVYLSIYPSTSACMYASKSNNIVCSRPVNTCMYSYICIV